MHHCARVLLPILILAAGLAPGTASARQTAAAADTVRTVVEIELRDGSRFIGTIVEESADIVVLRTSAGTEVRIDPAQIVSRRRIEGRVTDGAFKRFDPNRTRLFFAPTARPMPQGTGYFAAYYVVFGFVAVGVTDRFTMAGGTLLIPDPDVFGKFGYVAPKMTLYQEGSTSAGVGVLAGFAEGGYGGILYGVATRGHADRAVTLGLGFAFSDDEVNDSPALMVGFEGGGGRNTKFISENWIFPASADLPAILSGGVRFYGDRLAADLGFFFAVGSTGGAPPIPWVSFAYNFGK